MYSVVATTIRSAGADLSCAAVRYQADLKMGTTLSTHPTRKFAMGISKRSARSISMGSSMAVDRERLLSQRLNRIDDPELAPLITQKTKDTIEESQSSIYSLHIVISGHGDRTE